MSVQYLTANGLRFAFLEEGQGPLVLLIHGFPDTAHTWDDLRPRIAERGYRVVSPWTRGYHPTGIPPDDADGLTLGLDVVAWIDRLSDDGTAIVVGHDWGAAAAYIAAALFPDKLRRLFALAIPHPGAIRRRLRKAWGVRHFLFYKMPGAAHRFAKDEFAALEAIYRRWSPSWEPSAGEFDAVRETFANRASLDSAMGYYRSLPVRLPNYLRKKISVDTVVFAGADDPVVTPTDYFDAKHMFTGDYKVEVVPGGHFLHREHPERFAEQLLAHFS